MTVAQTKPASPAADDVYLASTYFIDAGDPRVRAFAVAKAGQGSDKERAIRLYYAVRDEIRYDPYSLNMRRDTLTASFILKEGRGYCVTKAVLLAAAARAVGIPARLGFGDVRNHLSTERLRQSMGTDLFYYHGYTELLIDGRWVKATPAFNIELCEKFGVLPLEFDGETDSVFHPYTADNRRHMEYVTDRGFRADLPYEELAEAMFRLYPGMTGETTAIGGDFHAEAESEAKQEGAR